MKPWDERPFEIRNLFNPAFCGVTLLRALEGYGEKDDSGMPFSLTLLVLPLCLYKDSREVIVNNPRRYLLKTISNNQQLLVDFPRRANSLLPYTFEGLGLAMHYNAFEVTEKGLLKLQTKGVRKKITGTDESVECQKVAKTIGRKFAEVGDRVTIYASLGIRP